MSVFANGMGVSGKATASKTIAAMPDVCLSPPPPPAGPVPIPYPMTGMASDTTDGCTTVIVMGKEAGKKNATKYSKTTGNEPATNSFGANVLSHKLSGALKFAAYSFDVLFEGGGACRFTDMTTQNHMNAGGGSLSIDIEKLEVADVDARSPCAALSAANQKAFDAAAKAGSGRKGTTKQRKKLRDFAESGTVSHALVTTSTGARSVVPGTSSGLLRRKSGDRFSKPIKSTKGQRKKNKIPQTICEGQPPHNHTDGGFYGHSEPCIFNDIAPVTKWAKMVMSIDWHQRLPDGSTEERKDACGHCKKVIAAACQCIKIRLCNADGSTRDGCKEATQ